ncbi:hypothetical protein CUR178_02944 [Leishmania enriettii]|uniref:Uncharacterized protein n=1 Tax=Leishmania enriettii TaxID=5663 RepID=A0A836H0I6_LEIEN|nr:hypothetical protein CUR178_02944 [Leishmania enriettii]
MLQVAVAVFRQGQGKLRKPPLQGALVHLQAVCSRRSSEVELHRRPCSVTLSTRGGRWATLCSGATR